MCKNMKNSKDFLVSLLYSLTNLNFIKKKTL